MSEDGRRHAPPRADARPSSGALAGLGRPGAGRLAVLISFSGEGGVERMVLNLVEGFAARGLGVDLLAIRADSAHLSELPHGVRLVAKDRAIRAAVLARGLAGVRTRIVGRLGTNLSAALEGRAGLARWLRTAPMRWFYPKVDHVVCVSQGVLEDTRALTGLPAERLSVIRNPVVTPRLAELADQPVDHPWAGDPAVPLVLGAGRLTEQKDFPTLVRAFARLRAGRPARLAILGEGRQRSLLESLARDLGVAEDVALPGFTSNPYAWMSKARLFVLSSAWEGSPNVLTEALALGVPSVATDCPSGPREILAGGRWGPLVPVGDDAALAAAMAATLDEHQPPDVLRAEVAAYTRDAAAAAYLQVLGVAGGF